MKADRVLIEVIMDQGGSFSLITSRELAEDFVAEWKEGINRMISIRGVADHRDANEVSTNLSRGSIIGTIITEVKL